MKHRGAKNLIITILCQLSLLAFGVLIPKITISNLGSEANGFLSTINEVFVYMSLLEGGLGLALLNSLYELISNNDTQQISDVMTASRIKYKKIAKIYMLITVGIALVFPLFLKSKLSYSEMALTIIAQGLGGAGTMYLSSSVGQYLIASGRNYVKEINHLVNYVLTSVSKILLIVWTKNIVIVTLAHTVFCLLEALIYRYYFAKKLPEINLDSKTPKFTNLSEQKYFLIHQISSAIFNATDLFVISIFCSLTASSIYAVYALIFTAISTVMSSVFNSLKYILGSAYTRGNQYYARIHDQFDAIYLAIMFSLYFTAFILANGFIRIYTFGADANYVDPYLPILFMTTKLLSSCRNVCSNTHNIAHRVRQNVIPTVVEAIINLSVSLALVGPLGIYGVLLGTVAALLFRTNQTIIYTNRFILNRSSWNTYKVIVLYVAAAAVMYFAIDRVVHIQFNSYLGFVKYLILLLPVVAIIYGLLALAVNRDVRQTVRAKVKRVVH